MKGIFMTFIIHVILVDKILSLSESDSCDGEQCGSVISMPIMDNMKASLKADLDVSKMNKHLKAYIEQEIEKGVKTAMENLMKQMIENKTEKMNAEIMTMFEKKDTEITVRFNNAEKRQKTKTDQMTQLIQNKSGEMLTLFQDNEDKSKTSFGVKMEEFEQKFEQKDRLNYAFFAHISSSQENLKIKTIVVFDVVPLNIGRVYDGTTGKFTCKKDGIYTFSWTTLSHDNMDFTSALVVDGRPIASNAVDNDVTRDAMTGSITVIVKMTKGQKAWITVLQPSTNRLSVSWSDNIPNTVFSGFKI